MVPEQMQTSLAPKGYGIRRAQKAHPPGRAVPVGAETASGGDQQGASGQAMGSAHEHGSQGR